MKKINLTPTWKQWTSTILLILEAGDETGKKLAKEELYKMAELADKFVEISKCPFKNCDNCQKIIEGE